MLLLVSTVTFALIAVSPALASGEVDALLQHNAAELAQQSGISVAQVEQDLVVQQRAGNIVKQLEGRLGSGYSGVWFDPATARFHVGLAPQTNAATAEAVMSDAGVMSNTALDPVKHTWAEVEAAQSSWSTQLQSLAHRQQAEVIADPRINGIRIELASNLSATTVEQTRQSAAATGVTADVVPVAPSSLEIKPVSCRFPYCERPLRGGIQIQATPEHGYETICTAGFFVRDANNYPYLLTAGHCVYPKESSGWRNAWGTSYPGGLTGCGLGRQIAQILSTGGDAAVIETEGCEPPAPETDIAAWNIEENYLIHNTPYSAYVGLFECHIGRTSASKCGYVEAANVGVSVNYTDVGMGIIAVQHEDWLCTSSAAGDSGGPWAAGHYGTAIETAGSSGCNSYGDELSYAMAALGVHLPSS